MKINPVAIQSYQDPERNERTPGALPDTNQSQKSESSVTISPQDAETGSHLAISAPRGDYTEFLTAEEKDALEVLFRRFNDPNRFGPAYHKGDQTGGENAVVGHVIDIKA